MKNKLLLTLILSLIVSVGMGQTKNTFETVGNGSICTKDQKGRLVDSVSNDKWYVWNYKKVPANGMYSAERVYTEKTSTYIEGYSFP